MNANSARKTELPYCYQFKYPDLDLTPPDKLKDFTEVKKDRDDEFNTSRLRFGYNNFKLHPDIFTPKKGNKKIPSNHVQYRKGIEVPWFDQYERGQTVPSVGK